MKNIVNRKYYCLLVVSLAANACAEQQLCDAYSGYPGNDLESGLVWINGGSFVMGSNHGHPEERLEHEVSVDGFWIDKHEVTNAQYAKFVEATGYVTVAERQPRAEDHPTVPAELLVPGSAVFMPPSTLINNVDMSQWWQYIAGADWRHPMGPDSNINGLENHPVVHITYEDALAYARWLGRDLPTEAQWEYAARGGDKKENDGVGKKPHLHGHSAANTWQGQFPIENTTRDGYQFTAPVGCFPANGYGVYDLIGNVWELTKNRYTPSHQTKTTNQELPVYVIKGGSFLCAPNFCARYRPSARQPQEADLGASHIGFRTVLNGPASMR